MKAEGDLRPDFANRWSFFTAADRARSNP